MYDEILQEKWPEFEKALKKHSEYGPLLAKVGSRELLDEARKRLNRCSKKGKNPEEIRELVFQEIAIFMYMLYHFRKIHKDDCKCSYCHLFKRLTAMLFRSTQKDGCLFFDTGKDYDGDVGFRLSNYA